MSAQCLQIKSIHKAMSPHVTKISQVFHHHICILQALKDWRWEQPGTKLAETAVHNCTKVGPTNINHSRTILLISSTSSLNFKRKKKLRLIRVHLEDTAEGGEYPTRCDNNHSNYDC